MSSQLRIIRAVTDEERRAVYRLRYRIFVEEMRYVIPGANPIHGIFEPSDEYAWLALAVDGDRHVGTMTVNHWGDGPLSDGIIGHYKLDHFAEHFPREAIAVVHKGLVAASHRGTPLFMRLITRAFEENQQAGTQFVFLDCSPGLVSFYERLGFRRYAPHFYYDDTGILSVPMCLPLTDHERLDAIGSPLRGLVKGSGVPDNPEVRAYFSRYWEPQRIDAGQEQPLALTDPMPALPAFELWQSPFFQGLAREEVESLIEHAQPRQIKRRTTVMSAGTPSDGLLLVVDGFLEISVDRGGRRIAIGTCGPGSMVGEISLLLGTPRTADVTALTDVSALHFSGDYLDSIGRERPSLASRLNWNLARLLAERLRVTNRWITEPPPL